MLTKRISLLGEGEVGSAIKKIAQENGFNVLVKELGRNDLDGRPVDALHVCIPYENQNFIDTIASVVRNSSPQVIIIHSTVPPGITREVAKKTKLPTAHSPIRGDHPDLYTAIKVDFVKYVGGVDRESARLAARNLQAIGIEKVEVVGDSLDTELGKLVNITGFAWSIVFCKWAARLCEYFGADFGIVYKRFTESYNDGYGRNKPNVRQAILKPVSGPIGGHCVIPDVEFLDRSFESALTKFILDENKTYRKEKSS